MRKMIMDILLCKGLSLLKFCLIIIADTISLLCSHAAASYGHAEIIEFLVRHAGAIIDIRDEEGDTPLLFCEKPEIYELLVSLGADAGARNTEGQGIVEKAVEDENEELVEYLINKGIINDADFIQKLRAAFESAGMEEFNGQFSMEEGDEGEEDEDDEEDSENHAA